MEAKIFDETFEEIQRSLNVVTATIQVPLIMYYHDWSKNGSN